jgi:hypothetical protein
MFTLRCQLSDIVPIDTGGKFATGVIATGVVDTGAADIDYTVVQLDFRISQGIFKKI